MGMHKHTYVGPYLEVKLPKQEKLTKDNCKADPVCGYLGDTTVFCPKCGIKKGQRFHSYTPSFDVYEILGDEMTQPLRESEDSGTRATLIPNYSEEYTFRDDDDEGATVMDPAGIIAGIAAFERDYAEEIEKVRYVAKSVSVMWGMISYYS